MIVPARAPAATTPETPDRGELRQVLEARLARPQRHRLLHGYPMAPLLRAAPAGLDPLAAFSGWAERPLIIGVLPHSYCNPKRRGCGFCTFPHEALKRGALDQVTRAVAQEIGQLGVHHPELGQRSVEAVYFGGGTANLTPPLALATLLEALAAQFALGDAELSLEGVPSYFLARQQGLLEVLAQAPVRHRRLSMGIQSFDPDWLVQMGREAFGDRATVARVVEAAHRRGFTVSADLLYNLPGAGRAHALFDLTTAMELGFDQICLYNLVLSPELDTAWAQDPQRLAGVPSPAQGCATWLALRDQLLGAGYQQSTLSNFERPGPPAFHYERASFDPARVDGLGFGPGALSTFTDPNRRTAHKWSNLERSSDYAAAVASPGPVVARHFPYRGLDLSLLHLTRNLSALRIPLAAYRRFFEREAALDFGVHFELLAEAGLLQSVDDDLALTPTGMFYADAVAGLLAHHRVLALRGNDRLALHQSMG